MYSCDLSYVGKLEWHGQGESQGVHIKLPGLSGYFGDLGVCLFISTLYMLHLVFDQ